MPLLAHSFGRWKVHLAEEGLEAGVGAQPAEVWPMTCEGEERVAVIIGTLGEHHRPVHFVYRR